MMESLLHGALVWLQIGATIFVIALALDKFRALSETFKEFGAIGLLIFSLTCVVLWPWCMWVTFEYWIGVWKARK